MSEIFKERLGAGVLFIPSELPDSSEFVSSMSSEEFGKVIIEVLSMPLEVATDSSCLFQGNG